MAELNLTDLLGSTANNAVKSTIVRTQEGLEEGKQLQSDLTQTVKDVEATGKQLDPLFDSVVKQTAQQGKAAKSTLQSKKGLDLANLADAYEISERSRTTLQDIDSARKDVSNQLANSAAQATEMQNLANGKTKDGKSGGIARTLGTLFFGDYYQNQANTAVNNTSKLAAAFATLTGAKATALSNAVQEQQLVTQDEYIAQTRYLDAKSVSDQLDVDGKVTTNQLATLTQKYNLDAKSIDNLKGAIQSQAQLLDAEGRFLGNLLSWEQIQTVGRAQRNEKEYIDALETKLVRFNEIHGAQLDPKVLARMFARPEGYKEVQTYINNGELSGLVMSYIATGVSSAAGNQSQEWGDKFSQAFATNLTPRDRLFQAQLQDVSSTFGISTKDISTSAMQLAGGEQAWANSTPEEQQKYQQEALKSAYSEAYRQKDKKGGELILQENGLILSDVNLKEYLPEDTVTNVMQYIGQDLAQGNTNSPADVGKALASAVVGVEQDDNLKTEEVLDALRNAIRDQIRNGLETKYSELYQDTSNVEFNVPFGSRLFGTDTYNILDPIEFEQFKLRARSSNSLQRKPSRGFILPGG